MLIGMGDSTPNGNLVGMQVNIPLVACGQIPQISIALRICTCASSDNLVFVYRNKHIGVLADKHLEKLFIRRHKPPEAQPVGMFQYTIEATYVIIIYCKPYRYTLLLCMLYAAAGFRCKPFVWRLGMKRIVYFLPMDAEIAI